MKLTNYAAQRLLAALRTIDAGETIRLSGKVRLNIARNINRLISDVMVFEQASGGKQREIRPGNDHLAENNKVVAELEQLRAVKIEVKLWRFTCEDLSLDDNPRITGDTIAALAPVLRNFDTLDPDEAEADEDAEPE